MKVIEAKIKVTRKKKVNIELPVDIDNGDYQAILILEPTKPSKAEKLTLPNYTTGFIHKEENFNRNYIYDDNGR